jgi:hypothetical protein
VQRLVQFDRRLEIAAERLLDDDAGRGRAPGSRQAGDDRAEGVWGDRQVVERPLRWPERRAQRVEGRRLLARVTVDVNTGRVEVELKDIGEKSDEEGADTEATTMTKDAA